MGNGTDIVNDVTAQVADAGKGLLSRMTSGVVGSPLNVVSGIFNAFTGLGKGVLSFGTLTNGLIWGGAIAIFKYATPNIWKGGIKAIGGDKMVADVAGDLERNGIEGMIKTSLVEGMAVSAIWNGASGAVNEVSNSENAGVASSAGGLVVLAGAAAAVAVALQKSGLIGSMAAHTSSPSIVPIKAAGAPSRTPTP